MQALRNVAQPRGIAKVAARSKLNRESLYQRLSMYRMLSRRGNPSLRSLGALLDGLGLKLTVERKGAA